MANLDVGGAQRQALLMHKALKQRGCLVNLVSLFGESVTEGHVVLSPNPLPDRKIRLASYLLGVCRLYCFIKSQQERGRATVLYSMLHTNNLFAVLMKIAIPSLKVALGYRGGLRLGIFESRRKILVLIAAFMVRVSQWPMIWKTIFNSKAALAQYRKNGYPFKNAIVIPNICDVTYSAAPQSKKSRSFCVLARWAPIKNIPATIEGFTFAMGAENCDGMSLTVGGELEKMIESGVPQRYSEYTNIKFVNAVSGDFQDVMRASEFFIFASHPGEGFPNVIAEAIGFGCIPLVTDSGDARVIVDDSTLHIDGFDAIHIEQAIKRSVGMSAEEKIQKSRALFDRLSKFNSKVIAAELDSALQT